MCFFYDKTWVLNQSERAQGPIYIMKLNYLLGLVIWCSFWTFRIIRIKTRFHHVTAVDSTLKTVEW